MYCTLTDIITESIPERTLIQLTDDLENPQGIVDVDKVNRAIANVCGEIDDLLGKHYTVPFTPVPKVIHNIALKQSAYAIYGLCSSADRPKNIVDDNSAATALLTRIARGDIRLQISLAGQDSPSIPTSIQIAATTPVMTAARLENF